LSIIISNERRSFMEDTPSLQGVTLKLLRQVETVLDEGNAGLSELKQVAAVLKDIRDVQKEVAPKEPVEGEIRVVLEGEVASYAK
jgi:hypothetical protein